MLIVGFADLSLAFFAVRSRPLVVLELATVAVIVVTLVLIAVAAFASATVVDVKEAQASGLGGRINATGRLCSSTGVVAVDDDGFVRKLVVDGS